MLYRKNICCEYTRTKKNVTVGNTICAKYWDLFPGLAYLNLYSTPIHVFLFFFLSIGGGLHHHRSLQKATLFQSVELPSFPVTFAPGTRRVGHGRNKLPVGRKRFRRNAHVAVGRVLPMHCSSYSASTGGPDHQDR